MKRYQEFIPSTILTVIAIWVAWISYTSEPAASFLFPRIVATAFVVLAVSSLIAAIMGSTTGSKGISLQMFKNMVPGLIVAVIYIFWAAAGNRGFKGFYDGPIGFYLTKGLGFYTATTLATFAIISLYDPAPHNQVGTWVKRVIITSIFVGVMYLLFSSLLSVYTPRETLF